MVAVRVVHVVAVYDEDFGNTINVNLNEEENRKNVEFCENCSADEATSVYHPTDGGTLVEFMTGRRYDSAVGEFDKRIEEVVWTE